MTTPRQKLYHYKQCGLDNVYLQNGFYYHQTSHGKGVSFDNLEGLHKAIGLSIIKCDRELDGKEFRFLRKEMEMTQADVARLFDCDTQTIARWEKHRISLPGPADRLIRLVYKEYVKESPEILALLNGLAELDALEHRKMHFQETRKGWKLAC